MISAINSGLSGLAVSSAMVATGAGNLANLNSTGFKSSRVALGPLTQGALEAANVDPAREMINLILGQRGFQAAIKVVQTADEMLGSVLDIRS